jgi:hypothetical protein
MSKAAAGRGHYLQGHVSRLQAHSRHLDVGMCDVMRSRSPEPEESRVDSVMHNYGGVWNTVSIT